MDFSLKFSLRRLFSSHQTLSISFDCFVIRIESLRNGSCMDLFRDVCNGFQQSWITTIQFVVFDNLWENGVLEVHDFPYAFGLDFGQFNLFLDGSSPKELLLIRSEYDYHLVWRIEVGYFGNRLLKVVTFFVDEAKFQILKAEGLNTSSMLELYGDYCAVMDYITKLNSGNSIHDIGWWYWTISWQLSSFFSSSFVWRGTRLFEFLEILIKEIVDESLEIHEIFNFNFQISACFVRQRSRLWNLILNSITIVDMSCMNIEIVNELNYFSIILVLLLIRIDDGILDFGVVVDLQPLDQMRLQGRLMHRWMDGSSGYGRFHCIWLHQINHSAHWLVSRWLTSTGRVWTWVRNMSTLVQVGLVNATVTSGSRQFHGYRADSKTVAIELCRMATPVSTHHELVLGGFDHTSPGVIDIGKAPLGIDLVYGSPSAAAVSTWMVSIGFEPGSGWCLHYSYLNSLDWKWIDPGTFVSIHVMIYLGPSDDIDESLLVIWNRPIKDCVCLCFYYTIRVGILYVISTAAYLHFRFFGRLPLNGHDLHGCDSGRFIICYVWTLQPPAACGYISAATTSFDSFTSTVFPIKSSELYSFKMAANLHAMIANLRLTEKEKAAVLESCPSDEVSMAADVKYGLVGKVITPRLINANTFIRVFSSVMADEHVEIMSLKPGIFLFKVPTEANLESLIKRGPWIYDGEPIAMKMFQPSLSLEEYRFDTMAWWIRVYDLPLDKMTMAMARKIGACFGELDHVDCRQINGNLSEHFRVKVELNINQPLLRMVILPNGDDGPRICPIQYEKLQKFCYFCGMLGHEVDLCPQEVPKNETLPYGPWLSVPFETRMPRSRARRGIVAAREIALPRVPSGPMLPAPDVPSSSTMAPAPMGATSLNATVSALVGTPQQSATAPAPLDVPPSCVTAPAPLCAPPSNAAAAAPTGANVIAPAAPTNAAGTLLMGAGEEGMTMGELEALDIDLPALGDDPVKTAEIISELLGDDETSLSVREGAALPIAADVNVNDGNGKANLAESCVKELEGKAAHDDPIGKEVGKAVQAETIVKDAVGKAVYAEPKDDATRPPMAKAIPYDAVKLKTSRPSDRADEGAAKGKPRALFDRADRGKMKATSAEGLDKRAVRTLAEDNVPIGQILRNREGSNTKGSYDSLVAAKAAGEKLAQAGDTLEGAGQRTPGTFRRKSLPGRVEPNIAVVAEMNADEASHGADRDRFELVRKPKRKDHSKHRPSSHAKRSRSGAELCTSDATVSTTESAEAVGQPRPAN
ncbi:hypothetical protein HRI_004139800 [Hibiscus trionum]|uniref:CCHC-type domain-containing protein n=1 Tax=Hibiscus trionum TaxID=183268 RepID=A0A9W7MPH7_HIBTR|nr:hypothetical protein HRI_004139800 [Hibiscus trionum]